MTTVTSDAGAWLKTASLRLALCSENPASEAQLILAEVMQCQRAFLAAHPEAPLTLQQLEQAESLLNRYVNGEPLPYVLGHWEFYGLDLVVTPAVLIPRPETELLVETALDWLHAHPAQRKLADVGTGSGCVAAALAIHISDLEVTALDVSGAALEVAQTNVRRLGLENRVTLVESNLLERLPEKVDVVCANLPYIPSQWLHELTVARQEPLVALDGGADGLYLIERLLADLAERGLCRSLVLLEIEYRQGRAVEQLARQYFPSATVNVRQDLAGLDRLLVMEVNHGD